MKKLISIPLICLLILISACSNSKLAAGTYYFDRTKYTVIAGSDGDRILPSTMDQLESRVRNLRSTSDEAVGVIALCEVAGASINRIDTPELNYNFSHVITPIKLLNIIYKGEDVSLNEGDIKYCEENFVYVTEETPVELERYGENAIISREYDPMEVGKKYILYMFYNTDIPRYDHNGEQILFICALRESVYCISDDAPYQGENRTLYYDELWQEVKAAYGELLN
ncbi:hypothetical protein FACS1894217_13960 [Clostridia bacterium]|nr:hypothetical protein FACS1894217_13960 [Clostridia bacterium]